MNIKITSFMTILILIIGVGVAQAEEQLSAVQMDVVTAAGYKGNQGKTPKETYYYIKLYNKYVEEGKGGKDATPVKPEKLTPAQTLAIADAFADCSGSAKCFAETATVAIVTKNTATSASHAIASTAGDPTKVASNNAGKY